MMKEAFEEIVQRTMHLGVDQVAYPIDVFEAANSLSSHADAVKRIEDLFPLVEDAENYLTRWASIRAISQMGPLAILRAKTVLSTQLDKEDYSLAKTEIEDALAKLDRQAP